MTAAASLDELFNQIIKSERHAQERKAYLLETKQKINQTQEFLQTLASENHSLRENFTAKVHELTEAEIDVSLMEKRQTILNEQKEKLHKEECEIKNNISNLEQEIQHNRETFCSEVRTFVDSYGLLNTGRAMREGEAEARLAQLTLEKCELQKRNDKYKEMKERVDYLLEDINKKKQMVHDKKLETQRKEKEIIEVREKISQREKDKEILQNLPQRDAEFQRLSKELEGAKSEKLEERCFHLQQEIQSLQQRLWQQQMKNRAKPDFNQSRVAAPVQAVVPSNTPPKTNRVCVSNFNARTLDPDLKVVEKESADFCQEDLNIVFIGEMDK